MRDTLGAGELAGWERGEAVGEGMETTERDFAVGRPGVMALGGLGRGEVTMSGAGALRGAGPLVGPRGVRSGAGRFGGGSSKEGARRCPTRARSSARTSCKPCRMRSSPSWWRERFTAGPWPRGVKGCVAGDGGRDWAPWVSVCCMARRCRGPFQRNWGPGGGVLRGGGGL